jgi:exodeoxyribonuclease X
MTGLDPEQDRVCELAYVTVSNATSQWQATEEMSAQLVNPGMPIPPAASAVHHIVDADVVQMPRIEAIIHRFVHPGEKFDVYVAHNASFEQSFLRQYDTTRPWICTWKCALRVWPDLTQHSNQFLRYALKLPVSRDPACLPHRALGDAIVTAHLLIALFNQGVTVEQMLEWSQEPPLFTIVNFGKHKGQRWDELPSDYLMWMIRVPDMSDDRKWNAQRIINNRRRKYVEDAIDVVTKTMKIESLNEWWLSDTKHRAEHSIVSGTAEYTQLVATCAAKKAQLQKVDVVSADRLAS